MNENAVAGERPASSSGLEGLVAGHLDLVYTAALRQVRDPHLAEDVTQTVFLTAARKAANIPADRTAAWLLKATRYIALTALRSQRRRRSHERLAAAPPTQMCTQPTEPEIDSTLDDALCALKESDRQIIILRYFKDHSILEVAASLRLTQNTASKRIERALERLRYQLSRRGVGVASATLGATLLAIAVRPAPKALAAEIAGAAAASAPVAVPVGILVMTLGVQLKLISVVVVFALLLAGAYVAISLTTGVSSQPASKSTTTQPVSAPAYIDPPGTTTLRGLVLGAKGQPIPNVLITQGEWGVGALNTDRATHTDSMGRFVLHRIVLGESLDLAAQIHGLAPELITGVVTLNPDAFTFTLKPAQTIRARIVDARGNPIAGLPVDPFFWRKAQVLRIYTFVNGNWNGPKTDANGLLVWNDAPPDPVSFDPITADQCLRARFTLTAAQTVQTVVIRDAIKVMMHVTDAQTGEAIPRFTIATGFGNDPTGALWPTQSPAAGAGGNYSTTIRASSPYHFFRAESPGYAPVVRAVDEKLDQDTLDFALSKTASLDLAVLDPNSRPAPRAYVYCIPPRNTFMLQESALLRDNRMAGVGGIPGLRTDGVGRLPITDPGVGAHLIVMDKAGYAAISLSDAAKAPIQLSAWATVQGQAFIGPKPASRQGIWLNYRSPGDEQPFAMGIFETTCDQEGNFRYSHIPPGEVEVGRVVETNVGSAFGQGTINDPTEFHLKPGVITQITIGGSGRAIVGRIVGEDGARIPDAVYSLGSLSGIRPMQYVFAVSYDGSFRLDDIKPGDYSLAITISSGKTSQLLGEVTKKVAVPPAPADGTDKPIDLGNLTMQP